jgi:hypothetical protein
MALSAAIIAAGVALFASANQAILKQRDPGSNCNVALPSSIRWPQPEDHHD